MTTTIPSGRDAGSPTSRRPAAPCPPTARSHARGHEKHLSTTSAFPWDDGDVRSPPEVCHARIQSVNVVTLSPPNTVTYPNGGRCPDCRATGLPNVWPSPGSVYCDAHAYARRAHQKREQKRSERARKNGRPAPQPEDYTPRPVGQVAGAYLNPTQVAAVAAALHDVRRAEDKVRFAIDGHDPHAVGLAAQDLLDAGLALRAALAPVDKAEHGHAPTRRSPRRGKSERSRPS